MSHRLAEWQRLLGESRLRLAALAGRLDGLTQRLSPAAAAAAGTTIEAQRPRPFGGADARPIDDHELKFEAVEEREKAP